MDKDIKYITGNYEPTIRWQVGHSNRSWDNYKFCSTIKSIENDNILFQESGIILNNDNLGEWKFTLEKNNSIVNGPIRHYNIFIEAYDNMGNTSAGNKIGHNANNFKNPNSYISIDIDNKRQTGIELKNDLYNSDFYIGPNGSLVIDFNSGVFNSSLVGGYVYSSKNPIEKEEFKDNNEVLKSRFNFNPYNPYIFHPTACSNLASSLSGYVSISFFDIMDEMLLSKNINIEKELYISNNQVVINNSIIGMLTLGKQQIQSVQYTGENPYDLKDCIIISSGKIGEMNTIIYTREIID
jgi:hypothetical protein